MDEHGGTDRTTAIIDREIGMVRGAIRMVASGGSRSLTVGGLSFGEQILALLTDEAATSGVILRAAWWTDERGCDIRVLAREDAA